MKRKDYKNLWPEAEKEIDNKDWRNALIIWAKKINHMIEDNTYIPKYSKYTREIVKLARLKEKEEERIAHTACQDILIGAVTTLINIGRGHKRYPKLTLYYSCEHERKLFWIKGDYKEWIIQWLYWVLAGRLMTPGGLIRLFLSFGVGAAIIFSFFYIGGLEWTDSTRKDTIEWYHYFYFSGLTLTTLGYGDLHPIPSDALRCFVSIFEAMIGYLLLGLMVAGFVRFNTTLHWPHKIDLSGKVSSYETKWEKFLTNHST